jgi:indole-3-glycerol phosphate synthase
LSRFVKKTGVLRTLADNSFRAIDEGHYDAGKYSLHSHTALSLRNYILANTEVPIICEIKFASPSRGTILDSSGINLVNLAGKLTTSGIVGLSVVTQPYMFKGSIDFLAKIRKTVTVPILMKDIIVSDVQIDAAKRIGADCILLIKSVFDEGLAEGTIEKFIDYAENKGLHVLLEVHQESEYKEVLSGVNDRLLIGINNRNLNNLDVDIDVTKRLLQSYKKGKNVVISESGISNSKQIGELLAMGADAFLVGTSIMESEDPLSKVKELCNRVD